MSVPFIILGLLAVAGATAAMTLRRLVHSALALAVCLIGLAGLYLNLGAQFVGLTQVMVYVGAVVILIVFAILLTRSDQLPSPRSTRYASGLVISACVFAVLAWAMTAGEMQGSVAGQPLAEMKEIGGALMQQYVLPLEVIGLLLTTALIGAAVIAMEEKQSTK